MKDVIQYYARCNKAINEQMCEIIDKNITNPMDSALEGYFFKTLGQLLEHVYIADMNWMKSFLAIDDYGLNIERDIGTVPGFDERLFGDFMEYRAARGRLDALIIDYSNKLKAEDFAKILSRVTRKGDKMEKLNWKSMIHFFNHQTHHRGQISGFLDMMKIENNYSNMISLD